MKHEEKAVIANSWYNGKNIMNGGVLNMGLLIDDKVKELVNRFKAINPYFKDNLMTSNLAFNHIKYINKDSIIFGARINSGKGIIAGTSDGILLVEKDIRSIDYDKISSIDDEQSFPFRKIKVHLIGEVLDFKVDKNESEYIVNNINTRIASVQNTDVIQKNNIIPSMKGITLKIIASDLPKDFKLKSEKYALYFERSKGMFSGTERIDILNNIQDIQLITEENKSSFATKAGWGFLGAAAGWLVFTPMIIPGLLAGVLAKGNKKEIGFACELKSGHRFVATTDNDSYQKLLAVTVIR